MALDIEDYRFFGLANTVALKEFAACFDDDRDNSACLKLLQEYKAAGSPKDMRRWLRERLTSIFVCLTSRPNWVEPIPMWPFWNGQAMVFLGQFAVEENEVSSVHLAPNTVLFVFGIRVPIEGGWRMQYQIVEQHQSLIRSKG